MRPQYHLRLEKGDVRFETDAPPSELKIAHQHYEKVRGMATPFRVLPGHLFDLLSCLARSGQLLFCDKPLVVNLFKHHKLQPNHQIALRDRTISLADCQAIGKGPPHWFIYRNGLRLFDEQLEWDELQASPISDPLPILQLTDPRGAFANLLLDLGERTVPYDSAYNTTYESDLLETGYIKQSVGSSTYYCPIDQVFDALTFLLECGWTVQDAQANRIHVQTAIQGAAALEDQVVAVRGTMQFGSHEADFQTVAAAYNKGSRFVPLQSGAVGLLPEKSPIPLNGEPIEKGVRLRRSCFGELEELFALPTITIDPKLQRSCAPPLSNFLGDLRAYQKEGVDWLFFLHSMGTGAFLADDMGLGKTVQVIAFLSRLPRDLRHLIVVPTSLIFNWQKEIARFLPDMPVTLYHGVDRTLDEQTVGVVITSYGTLRRDLPPLPFHTVILDEAQTIKNPDSQIAQICRTIPAAFRISLSGTPIENRWEELWSHFHFLVPDLLGKRSDFLAEVATCLGPIKKRLGPYILRRVKEEVAKDLPPKIEQDVLIPMDPEQRAVYDRLLGSSKTDNRLEILELILRLRQVCCHPLLIQSLTDVPAQSAKLDTLLTDLETLVQEGRKVLVYSQFAKMLHLIARHLPHPYLLLEGKTKNREELVYQFQNDSEVPIFFLSLTAGGVGLNLTAADTVILFDPWWNQAAEQQAIDRAHRIGQTKTILAKRYITPDSIEERLQELKAHKQSLGDAILHDGNALSTSELKNLLETIPY